MKNKVNIYVSLQDSNLENKWIISFLDNFIFSFKRVVKSNCSILIKGRDFAVSDYLSAAKNSDLFVFILSNNLKENQDFQNEIAGIINLPAADGEEQTVYQKFFKVCMESVEDDVIGVNQPTFVSYNFYDYNVRKKLSSTYTVDSESQKYWSKILDLVYDLNVSASEILEADNTNSRGYAYLAFGSTELTLNRDDVRRELIQMGYKILQPEEKPASIESFTLSVKSGLEKSNLIIQLIGHNYGTIPTGSKVSFEELENQIIREFTNQNTSVPRMIWIPSNLKLTDQRQDTFINKVRREDPGTNTEIIESGLIEFKNSIILRCSKVQDKVWETSAASSVYILCKTGTDIESVEEIIKKGNLKALKLEANNSQNLYQQHLNFLNTADGLIIHCADNDRNWLISKIRDIIKALGQGRNEPFKGICLIAENIGALNELNDWTPEMEVIKPGENEKLVQFINRIKG